MEVSEESDEERCEANTASETNVWQEICDKFYDDRKQIEEYQNSKLTDCDRIINPAVKYLDEEVFVILVEILEKTLFKAQETNSLQYHKSTYNAMDFIAENLWNLNPKHPERKENWTCLFDMDWVKDYLEVHPRPRFPFSWIWSKETAALKIQSYMRGYWLRRRENVQEVRQFWKALLEERHELDSRPKMKECECGKVNPDEDSSCYF